MRKVMCGFVLPLFSAVLTFWARLEWHRDMHPPEAEWWAWTFALWATGVMLGFGVCAYWFRGGHRQDDTARRQAKTQGRELTMHKWRGALWLLVSVFALALTQTPSAHANYFAYPCNYPFVGSGADVNVIVDASGQYCDGPTEINWSHYHCWSGGATVNLGAFAFAPVGPLSVGGVGGNGIGGNGGECRYVCPDGMVTPFPNPPAAWVKPMVLDPKKSDCIGHMGIRGPTSTPTVNELPGNMQPGDDPPDGVPVPVAPGAFPEGETNPPALPGPPPLHPPGAPVTGAGGPPMPSGKPLTPSNNDESPLTPGSPMQLP